MPAASGRAWRSRHSGSRAAAPDSPDAHPWRVRLTPLPREDGGIVASTELTAGPVLRRVPPMSERDRAPGMKSAYELALERMEREGIEQPREDAVSAETRREMDEVRRRAEAKLAELEILHRDRRRTLGDPAARAEEEKEYLAERRRIEDQRDRQIEKLRGG